MKLPKTYEPALYESDIYALWEKTGTFAQKGKGKGFSVAIPPPNANGNLHLGHALTIAIEDIATRYHRLQGYDAVLLPGADHAGFETQVVYEKQLEKEGKSRFDFSREQLYSQIWDFVAANRHTFENQFRRLGAGVDWSRFTFTLDDKVISRTYSTFHKMWDEGLIYRGERLVNFCTFHGTAFADIEVLFKEEEGKLWQIRYPLVDGSGEIIVATSRPETMFGDTAVAVNPDDDRYKHLIGRTVKLPLTEREIPIVTDSYVDPAFGTGAVKITPAHDPNDFEVGKRHDLPFITVIDTEGKINQEAPDNYRGKLVKEARELVAGDLAEQGFLQAVDSYTHSVGHCYKCDTTIEPLLREQWFVDMKPLADKAIKVLKADEIKFYPKSKKLQLIAYLENLRDWNISRQIAWGIAIPAFQNVDNPDDWIYDERTDQEIIEVDGKTYHRDPDVFDTWFSSSSWPYVTTNYPDKQGSDEFYPLSLMETGFDILMPWVSRMLMLGLYVTGKAPFKTVFLHGLILDEHGQKMSKSKGNVINPMDIIGKYGSDALRMGVISGQTPGSNQPFGYSKVVGARNFCNKLWNVARFIEGLAGDNYQAKSPELATIADHWIINKLAQSSEEISSLLEDYRLSEAYDSLYHFVWDDFADWYIEVSKSSPNIPVLVYCLESILKLAHPFAPFVTETIWQTLDLTGDSILASQKWSEVKKSDKDRAEEFNNLRAIVTEARYIIKALNAHDVTLYFTDVPFLKNNADLIKRLAKLTAVKEVRDGNGLYLTSTAYRCWLDIDQATAAHFGKELLAQQEVQATLITQLETRLQNEDYLKKAPKTLVQQTKDQLAEAKRRSEELVAQRERFNL